MFFWKQSIIQLFFSFNEANILSEYMEKGLRGLYDLHHGMATLYRLYSKAYSLSCVLTSNPSLSCAQSASKLSLVLPLLLFLGVFK